MSNIVGNENNIYPFCSTALKVTFASINDLLLPTINHMESKIKGSIAHYL